VSDFGVQRLLVLSIVDELRRSFRYLHPCNRNSHAYSVALYSIVLQAASAAERIIKQRCTELGEQCKLKTPSGRKLLSEKLHFTGTGVVFHEWLDGRVFSPFQTWASEESTPWWESYNSIKHDADVSLISSTLENAVDCVSASILALGRHLLSDGMMWLHENQTTSAQTSRFSDLGFSVVAPEGFWANGNFQR
jgi:hypothetical protein